MKDESSLTLRQRFRFSRFFRGESPVAGPITLSQRRIFILPTLRGLGFALLIVLLLLIAFVYNNNLAYLLGFLLASIFFITILHSFKALNGLIVQAGFNQPVFAGDTAVFHFYVRNPSFLGRHALEITLQESRMFDLDAQQSASLALPVATLRRGWLDCGTVTLASHYPLGMFRAWSPLRFNSKVLVYPQPVTRGRPFPECVGEDARMGRSLKRGDEFYGLKTYQAGDSIRQIHWKSFAKGQEVQSKHYAAAVSQELWLDYAEVPGSDVEERIGQLCRWIIDAEQGGVRYGLRIPGYSIAPSQGVTHYHVCLQTLAQF